MSEKTALVLVSNRGPATFEGGEPRRGGGGLVTALTGLVHHREVTWVASAMTEGDIEVRQQMIVLDRGRWVRHLDIIFRRHREEPLQTRARMFRALALEAMRQEQHETAETFPFVFGAGDELIDDDLRDVPEIAELRLPANQSRRRVEAIAVFESQDADFRQRRIINLHGTLVWIDMLQWDVTMAVLVIVENGMAMTEGAAADILTAQTHGVFIHRQRRERQGLRR
jgi:hypothetical protein